MRVFLKPCQDKESQTRLLFREALYSWKIPKIGTLSTRATSEEQRLYGQDEFELAKPTEIANVRERKNTVNINMWGRLSLDIDRVFVAGFMGCFHCDCYCFGGYLLGLAKTYPLRGAHEPVQLKRMQLREPWLTIRLFKQWALYGDRTAMAPQGRTKGAVTKTGPL